MAYSFVKHFLILTEIVISRICEIASLPISILLKLQVQVKQIKCSMDFDNALLCIFYLNCCVTLDVALGAHGRFCGGPSMGVCGLEKCWGECAVPVAAAPRPTGEPSPREPAAEAEYESGGHLLSPSEKRGCICWMAKTSARKPIALKSSPPKRAPPSTSPGSLPSRPLVTQGPYLNEERRVAYRSFSWLETSK